MAARSRIFNTRLASSFSRLVTTRIHLDKIEVSNWANKAQTSFTKEDFKAVREIYSQLANEIDEETVKNFRSRLEACVAANGHPINNSIKVSKPNYHYDMDLDDDDTDEEYIE